MPKFDASATASMRPRREARKTIHMDAAGVPIVRVSLEGQVSDEDFQAYLRNSDDLIQAGQAYALIYDGLRTTGLSPRQRRQQVEWIQANRPSLVKLCRGAAFVINSSVVRGVLTAIIWVEAMPFEYVVVGSLIEAEQWVRKRLDETAPGA